MARHQNLGGRLHVAQLSLVLALSLPGLARGQALAEQDPAQDAEVTAAARSLAVEGVKLARAGHCAQALDKLERAEALHHSSIVLAELGECYLRLGKVVKASEALRSVVREGLPPEPSPAQTQALQRAQGSLPQALARMAQLTLDVHGPSPDAVQVTIDGILVPSALLGVSRPTDPGAHDLAVSAPGFLSDASSLQLEPGEMRVLTLHLRAVAQAPRARSEPSAPSLANHAAEQQPRAASARQRGAYAALGVGAVVAAAGVVAGGMAVRYARRLDERCQGDACPETSRDDLSAGRRWALSSSILLASGAASLIVGGVLLILERRDTRSARAQRARWSLSSVGDVGLAARRSF